MDLTIDKSMLIKDRDAWKKLALEYREMLGKVYHTPHCFKRTRAYYDCTCDEQDVKRTLSLPMPEEK